MKSKINKEELEKYLKTGMSCRDIAQKGLIKSGYRELCHMAHRYGIADNMNYAKAGYPDESYMSVIDTKGKAYILGYTLADGYIGDSGIEFGCAIKDRELIEFIAGCIGGPKVRFDNTLIKESRRFPRCRYHIKNKHIIADMKRHCQGTKQDKTFTRIRKDLEHYMLLGFFDGDGCLTWGRRKDRNRLWHKVCFTGSYKLLYAIQKLLVNKGITSSLHPKGDENCYVLEVASRRDVLAILKYMYGNEDLVVLHRKYEKYNALRLELGEFGEDQRTPSQAHGEPCEGVETTGGKNGSLNDQV